MSKCRGQRVPGLGRLAFQGGRPLSFNWSSLWSGATGAHRAFRRRIAIFVASPGTALIHLSEFPPESSPRPPRHCRSVHASRAQLEPASAEPCAEAICHLGNRSIRQTCIVVDLVVLVPIIVVPLRRATSLAVAWRAYLCPRPEPPNRLHLTCSSANSSRIIINPGPCLPPADLPSTFHRDPESYRTLPRITSVAPIQDRAASWACPWKAAASRSKSMCPITKVQTTSLLLS